MITQLLVTKTLSGKFDYGLVVFIEKNYHTLSVPILQPDHIPIRVIVWCTAIGRITLLNYMNMGRLYFSDIFLVKTWGYCFFTRVILTISLFYISLLK